MKMSISVGVEEGFVGSGRPMKVDIGCLKMSKLYQHMSQKFDLISVTETLKLRCNSTNFM